MIRNCPDCKKNFETKLSRQKKCDTCKYNTCETCGGHEDSIGTGTIKAIFVNSDKAERKDSE